MDTSESPETEAAGGEAQSHPPTLPPENGLDQVILTRLVHP